MSPLAISSAAAHEKGLELALGGAGNVTLSWQWVRDHGEDESSLDPTTKQRRVYAIGSADQKAATTAAVEVIDDTAVVTLSWPEAPHESWISIATLSGLLGPSPVAATQLWDRPEQPTPSTSTVANVLGDDEALAGWLNDIARFGYGTLSGFSGGHEAVTKLANRIGYPRSTIFGTTWDLASDVDHHDDTAYSQSFLAPHTDATYSHDAPGLQVFCCTDRSGTGGESIVVDAFAIAQTLRDDQPDEFEALTRVSVPGHYIEPGVELRASRPAIRLDDVGDVIQVSMNNYDRSPMLLPPEEMAMFYRAYGRLHDLANDQARWLSIRLEPGDVLINDNWRVLHGRHAYSGARRFIGCYLNHEDLESRIRTLR